MPDSVGFPTSLEMSHHPSLWNWVVMKEVSKDTPAQTPVFELHFENNINPGLLTPKRF
jgi:hypothetical protein